MTSLDKTPRPSYSLRELALYFLKLGYSGFGGPVALVGYMYRDLVERNGWITEEEYKEGLALSQLAPGPLAAQLSIYIGYLHYGIAGATVAGLAFVLPSFIMVVVIGVFYKLYGAMSWLQAAFYGVAAAVIGIIALSTYKLTIKSISKINLQAITDHWLLWLIYLSAAAITFLSESESIILLIVSGVLYMLVKAPPQFLRKGHFNTYLLGLGILQVDTGILTRIGLFFLKAGAFVFGSGIAIVPFLHSGVVVENKWLTEQQFLDAVAVAMITPGPVVITVGFIGYIIAGLPGAIVASLATFLPCYLITIICAPYFKKIAQNKSIKAFVDGITAAVVGTLLGAVIVIARRSVFDIPTITIVMITVLILLYFKKIPEPIIVLGAAIVGVAMKILDT